MASGKVNLIEVSLRGRGTQACGGGAGGLEDSD